MNGRTPAFSLDRAASLERLARARYFAYNQKRTMPPRINPVGIMFIILTAGIIFIGLTITIVANWPGLASIGENRLKVAGPIILCIGFIACVITIISMCIWVSRQNKEWERDMTEKAHQFINSSQSQEPFDKYTIDQRNNIQLDSQKTDQQTKYETHKNSKSICSNNVECYNGLEIEAIPNPIRVQKKRLSQSKEGNNSKGSSNQSFSAGEGDMNIPGTSFGIPRDSISPPNICLKENEIERYNRVSKTTNKIMRNDNKYVDPIRHTLENGGKKHYMSNPGISVVIKAKYNTAILITPSSTPPTGDGHPARISVDTEI